MLSQGLDPDLVLVNGACWDRVGELAWLACDPALPAIPVLVVTGTNGQRRGGEPEGAS
jgi:hypothetical protein